MFLGLLFWSTLAAAQSSECASASRSGDEVTLRAESWDPVMVIGRELAHRYGISVSVEDPKWAFPLDTEDVAVADPKFSAERHDTHYLMMKSHVLQLTFYVSRNGTPEGVPRVLRQLAEAANREMTYAYRLDEDESEGNYALVATKAPNRAGGMVNIEPLLDHLVTIPSGTRSISLHASLMAKELSRQTGLNVSCCQAFVAGVPWGMASIPFEANDRPARDVLRELIRAEDKANSTSPIRHPSFDHWMVRCDGTGAPWCFIEVQGKYSNPCPSSRY